MSPVMNIGYLFRWHTLFRQSLTFLTILLNKFTSITFVISIYRKADCIKMDGRKYRAGIT